MRTTVCRKYPKSCIYLLAPARSLLSLSRLSLKGSMIFGVLFRPWSGFAYAAVDGDEELPPSALGLAKAELRVPDRAFPAGPGSDEESLYHAAASWFGV